MEQTVLDALTLLEAGALAAQSLTSAPCVPMALTLIQRYRCANLASLCLDLTVSNVPLLLNAHSVTKECLFSKAVVLTAKQAAANVLAKYANNVHQIIQ